MKKVFCRILCAFLILLGLVFCLNACNIKYNNEDTTTMTNKIEQITPNTTVEETTPNETTPAETTPEETTPGETIPVEHEHIMGDEYMCTICGVSFLTPVEKAIEIGMSYEKGTFGEEYYYVELTLDKQVSLDGFARATIADGLYVSVAGGYLTDDEQGSIQLGDTVVFKAKLGAVNSSLTTGGKEVRLFGVAAYEIVAYANPPKYEVLVEKELIVPATGTGVAEKRLQYYLDAEGTVRKEVKEFQSLFQQGSKSLRRKSYTYIHLP